MEKESYYPYELDKVSGHLFCKYCGNNYLTHEHKADCEYANKDIEGDR